MATTSISPEIVPLGELKAFLRVETDVEDALLAGMLRSAQATIEAWVGQLLVRREIVEEGQVRDGCVRLSLGPVEAIFSVARREADGTFSELSDDQWTELLSGGSRASIRLQGAAAGRVRVRYRAGIAEHWNEVPEPLRLAVMRTAAHAFANRDSSEDAGVPPVVRQLLASWRSIRMI